MSDKEEKVEIKEKAYVLPPPEEPKEEPKEEPPSEPPDEED